MLAPGRPSCRDEEGKTGLFLSIGGHFVFLSSGDGYVRELLELYQGCQRPFRSSRGKVGFFSRLCSGKGPHLELRGESPGFSRVAAGNMGFFSS